MRYSKTIIGLTVAGFFCLSCQSNSYQINGFARELNDGDTICMAYDSLPDKPFAFALVDKGKFMFTGETNSTTLCRIYPSLRPDKEVTLFIEPEQMTVELSTNPVLNRVSGSIINNQWQFLGDSIRILGEEAIRIIQQPVTDATTQQKRVGIIDSLHRRMSQCILNTARRNRDNALGQYIRENYKEPEFK